MLKAWVIKLNGKGKSTGFVDETLNKVLHKGTPPTIEVYGVVVFQFVSSALLL